MDDLVLAGWRVKPRENRICRRGRVVDLQPRCMGLLICLARARGRVVSRQELFDRVWAGRVVGEDALNNCVKKLRRALDDDPRKPRFIETINGRGYRLVATVREPSSRCRRLARAGLAGGVLAVALVTLAVTHARFSVHRFNESDSAEETRMKLARLNGEILQDGHEGHALSIRLHGDRNED